MALDGVKNFAESTLLSGITVDAVFLIVASGEGIKFPNPATAQYNLVIWNSSEYSNPSFDPHVEIVRVTARSTDTFTITRAQESTTARAHNLSGRTYSVGLMLTAKMITDIAARNVPQTKSGTIVSGVTGLVMDYEIDVIIGFFVETGFIQPIGTGSAPNYSVSGDTVTLLEGLDVALDGSAYTIIYFKK